MYYIVVLIVGLIGGIYVGNMLLPHRTLKRKPLDDDGVTSKGNGHNPSDLEDIAASIAAIEDRVKNLEKKAVRK